MRDLIALLRPAQWAKNAFVLAPLVFARRFFDAGDLADASLAFVSFCLASSASYTFNDIIDRDRDRSHPLKANRPLAAGRVSGAVAAALAGALVAAALVSGWPLGSEFLAILAAFLVLHALYSAALKSLVVVDVMAIAGAFVLRAAGGVVAVEARMSPWLFVCTFLLALFLALGKRRHEAVLLGADAGGHREVLGRYSVRLLDLLIVVVSVATVVVYALYTVAPEVESKLGTERLYLTVPFVVFGVFRYLFLVYGRDQGGNPTEVLLADIPLQAGIGLWIGTVFWLLYG